MPPAETATSLGGVMPPAVDLSAILAVLRIIRGWNQAKLAKEAGVRPATISDWERKKNPSLRTLERLLAIMGYPPGFIQRTFAFIEEARDATTGPVTAGELAQRVEAIATGVGRDVTDFVRAGLTRLVAQTTAIQERCRAPFLWERLRRYGTAERRAVVKESGDFRSWGLCELVCEESVKAAPHKPDRALELAELALLIAGLIPGDDHLLSELQSHAWAFVGNARRVGGNLPSADEAFSKSDELWPAGSLGGSGWLDPSRKLDLEASLRRSQGRLPQSIELLDRALALCPPEREASILVIKGKTLEDLGDYEGSVAALRRAASLIKEDDPRLALCVRFNLLVNLCFLGRHAEAAAGSGLVEVRDRTQQLGNDLDRVRLRWLEGRIAAGLGRSEEAIEALRQVRADFANRGIAYDTAVVTLELAVLLADFSRPSEVKDLARSTAPLFQAQGVHQGALAALSLFRKAAEDETLTVFLARDILDYLLKAQRDPELRFVLKNHEEKGREEKRSSRRGRSIT